MQRNQFWRINIAISTAHDLFTVSQEEDFL